MTVKLSIAALLTAVLLPFTSTWTDDGAVLLAGNILFVYLLPLYHYFQQTMTTNMSNKVVRLLLNVAPSILITGLCIGIEFLSALLIESNIQITRFIPIQILPWGLIFWIAKLNSEKDSFMTEPSPPSTIEEEENPQVDIIDSITVKVRKQLHIIPVDTITYLQGEGDYVAIVVGNDRYLKEETLKYFETALPPNGFTRIHRSYLVNNRMIESIELYGKQQYLVEMKNGDKIKATTSGYRLLKSKLNI